MEEDEINKEKILKELEETRERQIIPDKEEAKKADLNSVPTKTKIAAWWMIIVLPSTLIISFIILLISY